MTDLTPAYWESLAILAAMVLVLVVGGSLVIRIVARGAERRVQRAVMAGTMSRGEARATITPGWPVPEDDERPTYPTIPVTVFDLPSFARRRRTGESFTDFADRVGLE